MWNKCYTHMSLKTLHTIEAVGLQIDILRAESPKPVMMQQDDQQQPFNFSTAQHGETVPSSGKITHDLPSSSSQQTQVVDEGVDSEPVINQDEAKDEDHEDEVHDEVQAQAGLDEPVVLVDDTFTKDLTVTQQLERMRALRERVGAQMEVCRNVCLL